MLFFYHVFLIFFKEKTYWLFLQLRLVLGHVFFPTIFRENCFSLLISGLGRRINIYIYFLIGTKRPEVYSFKVSIFRKITLGLQLIKEEQIKVCKKNTYILCTVSKVFDFPRYDMKSSGENETLRGIFHVVSRFPLHFMIYRGNLDYFLDSVEHSIKFEFIFKSVLIFISSSPVCFGHLYFY